MLIIGADPGLSGALAFLRTSTTGPLLTIEDMPALAAGKRREVSPQLLSSILAAQVKDSDSMHAYVELASAAPIKGRRQGTVSMFSFGRSYGVLLGVLAAMQVPTQLVAPTTWRTAQRLGKGKDASRVKAVAMYPAFSSWFARVQDHGRADALLIADYGMRLNTPDHVRVSERWDSIFS
jgi:crossover junction endodeoxyribonuclease RuvC